MASEMEIKFTKQMRDVTRDIHNVSDALINAKLGIAMTEDRVWAEGLLVFYEVFRFLEEALERHSHSLVGELDVPGMRRTAAFEKDLTHYLGPDWKDGYEPRESVRHYLEHLNRIEDESPYLLLAYVYHLYMGLLSGGQILRRKRAFLLKLRFSRKDVSEGMAVTEVDGSVSRVKRRLTEAMERVAQELDEETRRRLLEESRMVFVLNNRAVQSIEGAGAAVAMKVVKLGVYGALAALLFAYVRRFFTG